MISSQLILKAIILLIVLLLSLIGVGFLYSVIEQAYDFRIPFGRGIIPVAIAWFAAIFYKRKFG
jgi:hypothetical protein